jgi:DNA-binding NarL/FixJ family response regulator
MNLNEALDQIQRQPDADLLLLDLNMPGMNGVQTVSSVKRDYPELPVVILSAEEDQEAVKRLLSAGVAGYIPKSSSSQVMISALRLILAGGIYVPPQMLKLDTPVPCVHENIRPANHTWHLTERQMEVLRLISNGLPNKQICRELGLGEGTVKAHLVAIFRALDAKNRTEATTAARRLGLIA